LEDFNPSNNQVSAMVFIVWVHSFVWGVHPNLGGFMDDHKIGMRPKKMRYKHPTKQGKILRITLICKENH